MPRRRRSWVAAALVAASVFGPRSGAAGDPALPVCREGISSATATRLFRVLNQSPAEPECRFEGVETRQRALEARWSHAGVALPPVSVVPRACAPKAAVHNGPFVVEVPPELGQHCPSVLPLIAEFLRQVASEVPAGEFGSRRDPLFRGARALFIGILLVASALGVGSARELRRWKARWVVLGSATFAAALLLRAALPFTLGNWYSEVLPAFGPPPWMRFGPGSFAFQSLLRDAGLWGPRALRVTQVLIGAAAIPLLLGALRELRVGPYASAATLVLFVVAPFHARLSATTSEHVLASTLCVGLLFTWLRAARTGDLVWLALAALLFPAVCATRVDMAVQASLVLPWPLLRDRAEGAGLERRSRRWRVALIALIAAATLAGTYGLIALPSHHPLPEARERMAALAALIPECWQLATRDPAWISLAAVLLAAVGAAAMAVRRPWLLVRIAATVLIPFVALGRSFLPDELLGARYFLFTIPVFLIASGEGCAALLGLVPGRYRPVAGTAAILAVGAWSGLAARPAYAVRYAFQDEYEFARGALATLPAGCTVYAIPMRSDTVSRDVDCCLDARRSPLRLDFPQLRFRDLPEDVASVFESPGCVAYYESIACEIKDNPADPVVHDRAVPSAEYFARRCAEVRALGRLEALAEDTTSARATVDFFRTRPHVGLYRWTP